jgi:peptidoglycan/LPS O-acetylase OafA/YrhL
MQGASLTVLFIAAIRFHQWRVFKWLNTKVMMFIGLLSYSLYLLHLGVILRLEKALPQVNPAVRGVLSFATAIALAWLIYIAVERPCAQLRRKLTD